MNAFFEVCKKHIESKWPKDDECCHTLINFVLTPRLVKCPKTDAWKGVKDTRTNIHSICNHGEAFKVNYRQIICYCCKCMHGEKEGECENLDYVDEWRACDLNTGQEIEANMEYWSNVQICKLLGSRLTFNWDNKLEELNHFDTYNLLRRHVNHYPLPLLSLSVSDVLLPEHYLQIDYVALHYRLDDCPQDYSPCRVLGDGNCFPRAVSFLCFRTQEKYTEIRVRLIYEAVKNEQYYLSDRYLSRGAQIIYRKSGPSQQIAMYSSTYNPQMPRDVTGVYRREVLEMTNDGAYCGLWQIAQAANVLKHPIESIYPTNTNLVTWLNFNRSFDCINPRYNTRRTLRIMWTPMQVTETNRLPNHFVPMLQYVRTSPICITTCLQCHCAK